jgi:acetate kinase
MKIFVLNAGSSSHKVFLYDIVSNEPSEPLWQGELEGKENTSKRLLALLQSLWEGDGGIIKSPQEIVRIGHRIVHGGRKFLEPTQIDSQVKEDIRKLIPLAPLHNPAALEGIEIMERLFPSIPQIAVFDTSFHRSMPEATKTYPIPYCYKEEGIERFGFHGISHQYCKERTGNLLKNMHLPKIICCHLGNGASLCAIQNGLSIETTMGFTPLEGLMMGSRSGSIDPGILLYLLREKKLSLDELDHLLDFKSGLQGIASHSDMREVLNQIRLGNSLANLALDMYVHRLKSFIGALTTHLEGLDVLIFTAGIGENVPLVRQMTCQGLGFLGIQLDVDKNERCQPDQDIASENSKVRVLVLHTREEWKIAQECRNMAIQASSVH